MNRWLLTFETPPEVLEPYWHLNQIRGIAYYNNEHWSFLLNRDPFYHLIFVADFPIEPGTTMILWWGRDHRTKVTLLRPLREATDHELHEELRRRTLLKEKREELAALTVRMETLQRAISELENGPAVPPPPEPPHRDRGISAPALKGHHL